AGGRAAPHHAQPETAPPTAASRFAVATLLHRVVDRPDPPRSSALPAAALTPTPTPTPAALAVQLATTDLPAPPRPSAPAPAPAPGRLDLLAALSRADLDELATRLYDRLRGQLRAELLTDRDRVSDLADLWT
ncbi:MAG: hypothetical protein JWO60_1751, partial [Frankiales bacterium]|nr:hypothetical protein [Frankiales bacterium]